MSTLYVKTQGAIVGRKGERLVVRREGQVLDEIPLSNVEQVVLMGNVQVTAQATATLLEQEIDVVFLSLYGKFRGRLTGPGSKHVRLRQTQLKVMSQESQTLILAKAVVDGKIHNQRVLIQRQVTRLRRQGQQTVALTEALAGMEQMRRAAPQAETVDSLRGYEGKAAVYYFAAIRSLLDPAWGFEKRAYYPPPDPFNALLSFAYALLQKDLVSAVNQVGFDPYLGFFHEVDYGRPSLALDLMEEWRPVVADGLVMELINRGGLKPSDFQWTGAVKRPVQLGQEGSDRVLKMYGERLESAVYHPNAGPGGQTAIRQAIILQVRRLARVIAGLEPAYEAIQINP